MCESRENHDSSRRIVTYSMRLLSGDRNDNRQGAKNAPPTASIFRMLSASIAS